MFPFDVGDGFDTGDAILAGTIMGLASDEGLDESLIESSGENEANRQAVEELYHELDAMETKDRAPGMKHISTRRPVAASNEDWPAFEKAADDHIYGRKGLYDEM